MNLKAAEETSVLLLKLNAALNAQLALIEHQSDSAEFNIQRRLFGTAMSGLLDILNPIYREHPSLRPVQLGGSYNLPAAVVAESVSHLVGGA